MQGYILYIFEKKKLQKCGAYAEFPSNHSHTKDFYMQAFCYNSRIINKNRQIPAEHVPQFKSICVHAYTQALVHLHATATMMARHSVDGFLRAITGRVRDGVTVCPARVATYTLCHTILYVTYAMLVTHHVVARGNWKVKQQQNCLKL